MIKQKWMVRDDDFDADAFETKVPLKVKQSVCC